MKPKSEINYPPYAKCIKCGLRAPFVKKKKWYVCKCGCEFDPYLLSDIFSLTIRGKRGSLV